MQTINSFGEEIRAIRQKAGESLELTANFLGIDRSHLNKIELGSYKPSSRLLDKILDHFSVDDKKANQLRISRALQVESVVADKKKRKDNNMQEAQKAKTDVQVAFDPKIQTLYSDSILVNSTNYGLTMDIAQTAPGNPRQQFIVARIGISFDHAKKLVETINDHLEKNER